MEEEHEVLIEWLQTTFQVSEDEIGDGVAVCDCVSELIPHFLEDSTISRKPSSDRAKALNIQRAYRAIVDFLTSRYGTTSYAVEELDPRKVVAGDVEATTLLLRLIATTAVNSEKKDTYVNEILTNPDLAQRLMASITTVLNRLQKDEFKRDENGNASSDLETKLEAAEHRYRNLLIEYEELQKSTDEIELELSKKSSELEAHLRDGTGASEMDKQRIHDLQQEVEEAKMSLAAEQQEHEETKGTYQRALNEMRRQLESANEDAGEADKMRQELEEARRKCENMPALESRLKALQQQLTEAAEMKKQAETLRKTNEENIKRIVQLESYETAVHNHKDEMLTLSNKVGTLEEELLDAQRKSDRATHQLQVEREFTQRLKDDKTRLLKQQGELEHQVDLLRAGDVSASGLGASDDIEKLIRLEHENETLRARLEGESVDDQVEKLSTMLEQANASKAKLTNENRDLALQVTKLETEMSGGDMKSNAVAAIEKLALCERRITTLQEQLTEKTKAYNDISSKYSTMQEELLQAQTQLQLVGLNEKEMIERAKEVASGDTKDKLVKFETMALELEATAQKLSTVCEERDALREEHNNCAKKIAEILTEKDSITKRLLELQDSGVRQSSNEPSAELLQLREKLSEKTKRCQDLEDALVDRATDTSSEAMATEGAKVMGLLKNQITDLKNQLRTKEEEHARALKQYHREQQLMASAWSALSVEYQKLSVKQRERQSVRGASFLELQRMKAIDRRTSSNH
eukprot:m.52696 g.52696  ORF g.52696 m.52696 type:complete len:752 (+) comp11009_c0_seq2:59-2314(+)